MQETEAVDKRAKQVRDVVRHQKDRYTVLSHIKITVVHAQFHAALSRGEKCVEYRVARSAWSIAWQEVRGVFSQGYVMLKTSI